MKYKKIITILILFLVTIVMGGCLCDYSFKAQSGLPVKRTVKIDVPEFIGKIANHDDLNYVDMDYYGTVSWTKPDTFGTGNRLYTKQLFFKQVNIDDQGEFTVPLVKTILPFHCIRNNCPISIALVITFVHKSDTDHNLILRKYLCNLKSNTLTINEELKEDVQKISRSDLSIYIDGEGKAAISLEE